MIINLQNPCPGKDVIEAFKVAVGSITSPTRRWEVEETSLCVHGIGMAGAIAVPSYLTEHLAFFKRDGSGKLRFLTKISRWTKSSNGGDISRYATQMFLRPIPPNQIVDTVELDFTRQHDFDEWGGVAVAKTVDDPGWGDLRPDLASVVSQISAM